MTFDLFNAKILNTNTLIASVLVADLWQYLFGPLMFLTALFLILLVLVQRGRGGGLAGALGGMGGQSAFGTKAGDLFTKVTMGVATFWLILCCFAIGCLNQSVSSPPEAPSVSTETPSDLPPNQAPSE